MCTVINIHHGAKYDIYAGRPGKNLAGPFGNPHPVDKPCSICHVVHKRGEAVAAFENWFYSDDGHSMRQLVKEKIKPNMVLGCFCVPKKCHASIIASFVNNGYAKPSIKHEIEQDPWGF